MTNLPEWIEKASPVDNFRLKLALAIAWDAFQRIYEGKPKRFIANDAMRRIEELGK